MSRRPSLEQLNVSKYLCPDRRGSFENQESRQEVIHLYCLLVDEEGNLSPDLTTSEQLLYELAVLNFYFQENQKYNLGMEKRIERLQRRLCWALKSKEKKIHKVEPLLHSVHQFQTEYCQHSLFQFRQNGG